MRNCRKHRKEKFYEALAGETWHTVLNANNVDQAVSNLETVIDAHINTLQKMPFLNCVTVAQNMCRDGFLHPILRQNILARDDV